jgi:hypothetical protein
VLQIRDVYPGSWILIFTHPGSRIQKQQEKRGVKKIARTETGSVFRESQFNEETWGPGTMAAKL